MRRVVWKYPLTNLLTTDTHIVKIQAGAELLSVQIQYGVPTLWALVDFDEPELHEYEIMMRGTGFVLPNSLDCSAQFLSTVQTLGGDHVMHFFEVSRG